MESTKDNIALLAALKAFKKLSPETRRILVEIILNSANHDPGQLEGLAKQRLLLTGRTSETSLSPKKSGTRSLTF